MVNVFAVPVFFICFRECLETSIIVSVLLSFLKQTLGPERDRATYVWWGVGSGVAICCIVGGGMIGAFYGFGQNHFAGTEDIWEGVFGLIAAIIISAMGAALLRVSKLQDKWRVKLAQALEAKDNKQTSTGTRFKKWAEKYAMFLLPFVTVLREGLEAVAFIGGVSLGLPAASFPLAVIFLTISTCFLYLVAAGLLAKAVWFFENNTWNHVVGGDASEAGSGAGSYDIRQSVWHVDCCSPNINGGGGWGIFNSILGWTNSATYGTIISYNLYWLLVIVAFASMHYNEKTGHWPLRKPKTKVVQDGGSESGSSVLAEGVVEETQFVAKADTETGRPSTNTREITDEHHRAPFTRALTSA
ncbi:hypothetical protein LTR28_004829 [Elasticomyces elasticus]|nr:hypothetical protein LTR28_004829 [Elasticomyces elasticus]